MGMFDYFKCEYPLPGYPFFKPLEMQTKDLECDMKTYTLKPDGRLWVNDGACFNCGHDIEGSNISGHTGWVNAYAYQCLNNNFQKTYGYTTGEINYCLNFDFNFEFARGELLSMKDNSYCSILEWKEDAENTRNSRFRETKRLSMEEFITLYNVYQCKMVAVPVSKEGE